MYHNATMKKNNDIELSLAFYLYTEQIYKKYDTEKPPLD